MNKDYYITAIDLGSTQTRGAILHKSNHNKSDLVCYNVEQSAQNMIQQGQINDVEQAALSISKCIKNLETLFKEQTSKDITIQQCFVTINNALCRDKYKEGVTKWNAIQKQFQECTSPVKLQLITNRFEQLHKTYLSPNDAIGTALYIDFGNSCTSCALIENGSVQNENLLPVGSQSITTDLESYNLSKKNAEDLKIKVGRACTHTEDQKRTIKLPDDKSITYGDLDMIIQARIRQIFQPIIGACQPGFKIVLSGAGSHLHELETYLSQTSGCPVIKPQSQFNWSIPAELQDLAYNNLLACLNCETENCINFTKLQNDRRFGKILTKISNFFGPEIDISNEIINNDNH